MKHSNWMLTQPTHDALVRIERAACTCVRFEESFTDEPPR